MALLELDRSKRAAPARTWTVPVCSVLNLSPLKTVEPTDALAAPTWARSAYDSAGDHETVDFAGDCKTVNYPDDRNTVDAQTRH